MISRPRGGRPVAGITELCAACHVPHRPLMNVPLWAHSLSTATYQLYNQNQGYVGFGGTYDSSPALFAGSPTRLCLSCHDRSVAVAGNVYMDSQSPSWIMSDGGAVGSAQPGQAGYVGLKGSHPVGTTLGKIHGQARCKNCHNLHGGKPLLRFYQGKIQCTTLP